MLVSLDAGRRGRLRSQHNGALFQTTLREELMTSENANEDKSRKVIKIAVIVFSIIELLVMAAIIYSRKG